MASIVYFEDEQIWQEKYLELLTTNGHSVKCFSDGNELLRLLFSPADLERPDLVILDILDAASNQNIGLTVNEAIIEKWPQLPRIFLTTYDFRSKANFEALQTGAAFVRKDDDEAGLFLLAAVEHAVEKNRMGADINAIEVGRLKIMSGVLTAFWRDIDLKLTNVEFLILEYLAAKPDIVRRYKDIREIAQIRIYEDDLDYTSAEELELKISKRVKQTIGKHINRIRNKIKGVDTIIDKKSLLEKTQLIVNEPNVGYKISSKEARKFK